MNEYRDIVESAAELICRHLPDTTLTFVNAAYCSYYRKRKEELIGSSFLPFLSPEEQHRIQEMIARLSPECPVIIDEKQVVVPWNNEVRWQHWSNKGVFDESGTLIAVQAVARDITERKNAEEALENKNIALREIMEQIGEEKKQIIRDVMANIESVMMPILLQVRNAAGERVEKHIMLLEKSLQELAGSFGRQISEPMLRLTPREIEVSNMVRSGLSTKEIAELLHVSLYTVEGHRSSIRKKLKIDNKDVNLATYLQNMGQETG